MVVGGSEGQPEVSEKTYVWATYRSPGTYPCYVAGICLKRGQGRGGLETVLYPGCGEWGHGPGCQLRGDAEQLHTKGR